MEYLATATCNVRILAFSALASSPTLKDDVGIWLFNWLGTLQLSAANVLLQGVYAIQT